MEFLFTKIVEWWDTPKSLDEKMKGLKRKLEELNAVKVDMESSMSSELHPRKKLKKEVDLWFTNVERINHEIQDLEKKIGESYFFLRGVYYKGNVLKKIQEVENLYQRGKSHDSLVVDNSGWIGQFLPTTNLIGGAVEIYKKDIWACMMDDGIGNIGLWGMGGVGKTTILRNIHNDLLEANRFDKVIWVTISKGFSIAKLQDDIASALMGVLPKKGNKVRRAGMLLGMLEKAKKHVLILDDVWDKISLEEVGIPEPTSGNGCKLVLTTRKERVCKSMGCKVIKVNPLSDDDALALFLKKVGPEVSQSPTLVSKSRLVVKECAGLPLTVVVVAGTLKGEDDPRIWDNALNELKWRTREVEGMEAEVIECLKFSFDHLKDEKVKNCFLYCALYPEDFEISKDELIESWIDEGFINEMYTRQQMKDKGHAILKKLIDNSLLENAKYGRVKMHDAVREMALSIITSMNPPRYIIKEKLCMQLEGLPKEEEWAAEIEKVSLMRNSISEIPTYLSPPKCQLLTTLLLQHSPISRIPDSFFSNMPNLSVLDLSYTLMECLPNSISELKNLTALLLQSCIFLKHVPSLSKLQRLKKLNLSYSRIEEVPEGMEMLVNLRYLDLYVETLKEVPTGVLPKLSCLQHLRLISIKAVEIVSLEKLECIFGRFKDIDELKTFAQCKKSLNIYHLQVHSYDSFYIQEDKGIEIRESEICGDEILLPIDVQQLNITKCHSLRSLSDISCLKDAVDLRNCRIEFRQGIESVLSMSFSFSSILFQSLERLYLEYLPRLSEVIKVEGFGSSGSPILAPPAATFSHLKRIHMSKCSTMKKLFPHWFLSNLQNLEEIFVADCEQLVEILAVDDDEEKGTDKIKISLPKLRWFCLRSLPELKSICSKSGVMVCDSLEEIFVQNCSQLKRIPPFLPLHGDGQPYTYAPPSFMIKSSREWWESLEWDHPNFKNVLQPLWQEKWYFI
ncbi:hypothetical protein PTKIN_Ptkin14bG0105500 [Pterospermum kingtungense]